MVKTTTKWVGANKGKSGFDFYVCKIRVALLKERRTSTQGELDFERQIL
jgi:hypothetical protein